MSWNKNSNFMNVHAVWAGSFHVDGRTDTHDEGYCQFSKSKKCLAKTKLLRVEDGGGWAVVINVTIYIYIYIHTHTSSFPKE